MKNVLHKIISSIFTFVTVVSIFSLTVMAETTMYETVKDNVPIWSDASSKSTSLEPIKYAGTIVVADYSKINSSYNLWYHLTDNTWVYSGNVRKHEHKAIMCGLPSTSYEQLDSSKHTTISKSPEMCSCKQVMNYEIYKTTESHSFDTNNRCTKCGYQYVHIHEAIMCGLPSVRFEQSDTYQHILISESPEMCSCGQIMGYEYYQTSESHTYDSEKKCTKCGFVDSTHTHVAIACGEITTWYYPYDENHHQKVEEIPQYCECGDVINVEAKTTEEKHNFKDGFCKECDTAKPDSKVGQIIDQSIKGNYTDDVSIIGTIGEVAVGEIPFVGTVADIRDVYYDFTHDAGFTQTVLDIAGLIPFVGVVKYCDEAGTVIKHSDELGTVIKHTDEVSNVTESITELLLKSNSAKKWGTASNGQNQGIIHFVTYRIAEQSRITSLEKRLGLSEGAFNLTEKGFDTFTKQAERVISEATSIGNVRSVNGKFIYYIDGIANPKEGVVVIVYDGKLQTMMPSYFKRFQIMS